MDYKMELELVQEQLQNELKLIKAENLKLREENKHIKKLMENYYNSRQNYYEKNKEIVNEKAKERIKKLSKENPEKLKEIAHKAYLKRKEKLKKDII